MAPDAGTFLLRIQFCYSLQMRYTWQPALLISLFTQTIRLFGLPSLPSLPLLPLLPLLLLVLLDSTTNNLSAKDINRSFDTLVDAAVNRSGLQSEECRELYGLQGDRYQCGFLRVPEDYENSDSELIGVPYLLIFPEEGVHDTTLTPLLVAGGGGPGSAILGNPSYLLDDDSFWTYEEFSVVDGRTLMILENRGVGHSMPNLDCQYSPTLYQEPYWSALREADIACGLNHVSNEIDLSQYNVHNAALDIEMFRRLIADEHLNTKQINLYGISYGTRVAMYYERMFPETTRALILDSVALNEPNGSAQELAYAQRSLDLVFSKCRSDARCRKAYGENLESQFYEFLNTVDARSISLELQWPTVERPIAVDLTASLVIDVVHGALYGSDTFATIPLTVSQLLAGSYEEFTSALNAYIETYSIDYAFYDTAFLTYLCFDIDIDIDIDVASKQGTHFSELKMFDFWNLKSSHQHIQHVCSSYGARSQKDLLNAPYTSVTPTLFLSGQLDPITPPVSASRASIKYSYHWNIVRESTSHDVISHSACARFLASWFIYHLQEDLDDRLNECEPEAVIQFLPE